MGGLEGNKVVCLRVKVTDNAAKQIKANAYAAVLDSQI